MVEERRKSRNVYGIMFIFSGVVLLLVLTCFLGTTVVSNKIDSKRLEVHNLFCTFVRVPFDAKDTISNATGMRLTRVDVILGIGLPLNYYTYDASQEDLVDMGWLYYDQNEVLAFYSEELENGTRYVVDYGKIVYLNVVGYSDSKIPIVKINKIHQRNLFDDFVSKSSMQISVLMGFVFVLTCSLCCLPFIEYHINHKIEERKTKRRRKVSKKATDD